MFIKINKGGGFRGLLDYLIEHRDDADGHRGEVIGGNMSGKTPRELAAEFAFVRSLNPKLQKTVAHFSINLPPDEEAVDDDTFNELAGRLLDEMGFGNCPYVVIRHRDRAHQHCHIATSRCDLEGNVIPELGDFKKAKRVARLLESEFDLTTMIDRKEEKEMNEAKRQEVQRAWLERASKNNDKGITEEAPGIACADADLTEEKARSYKRRLLEDFYHVEIAKVLADDFAYVKRVPYGLVISLNPTGRIIDKGNKVIAEKLSNADAARRVIQFALLKEWSTIELFGNDDFIRLAMKEAIANNLSIAPKNERQRKILEEIRQEEAAIGASMVDQPSIKPSKVPEQVKTLKPEAHNLLARLAARRQQKVADDGQEKPTPRRPKL